MKGNKPEIPFLAIISTARILMTAVSRVQTYDSPNKDQLLLILTSILYLTDMTPVIFLCRCFVQHSGSER